MAKWQNLPELSSSIVPAMIYGQRKFKVLWRSYGGHSQVPMVTGCIQSNYKNQFMLALGLQDPPLPNQQSDDYNTIEEVRI